MHCQKKNVFWCSDSLRQPKQPGQPGQADLSNKRDLTRRDDLDEPSAMMRALAVHVDGIDRLTGRHEQAISLRSAEADVATYFRQKNLAYASSVFARENMNAVVAFTDPARTGPDVAVDVAANAIRETGLG